MSARQHRTPRPLFYGDIRVPYTVSWTEEGGIYLGECVHAPKHHPAMMQRSAPGAGKPLFSTPHAVRQREVIALGLCDICGGSLKRSTKVSLSQSRPVAHAANVGDILQVEPLLHKSCAREAMRHCPSLKKQRAQGVLMIRQVFRWQCQVALFDEQGTFFETGIARKSYSHAKVHLVDFRDRDAAWLRLDP